MQNLLSNFRCKKVFIVIVIDVNIGMAVLAKLNSKVLRPYKRCLILYCRKDVTFSFTLYIPLHLARQKGYFQDYKLTGKT